MGRFYRNDDAVFKAFLLELFFVPTHLQSIQDRRCWRRVLRHLKTENVDLDLSTARVHPKSTGTMIRFGIGSEYNGPFDLATWARSNGFFQKLFP